MNNKEKKLFTKQLFEIKEKVLKNIANLKTGPLNPIRFSFMQRAECNPPQI